MEGDAPQVVIMAGGTGQRLRPYTTVLPKPLMPIGDMSVLEALLRQLHSHGFRRVTLAVSYLAELIEALCGDGSRFGLEIRYSREREPLSTAGPLKLVEGLADTFVVLNGDTLTSLDFGDFLRFHRRCGAAATVATRRRKWEVEFGVVEAADDGSLLSYIEKPSFEHSVGIGIVVLEPRALDHIDAGERLDMPSLLLRLKEAGEPVFAYESECLWLDLSREEDHPGATELFEANKALFLPTS